MSPPGPSPPPMRGIAKRLPGVRALTHDARAIVMGEPGMIKPIMEGGLR
ncbi:hypothetical protein SAMN04489712_102167 [Thermomonospora echinospora]|uniref:Uncharacterized protein n=1 Tax=Thermomonospora echinospora TaxID=1992 RepID=A0A1H5V4N5_9ACTN|nr:hypothetical protein [Thermomonospora echinospora]SEF82372.1 hypothetical protein SAMN04489712_102167 [Thermomonospora echinospora]